MHSTEAAFIVFLSLFWLFSDLRGAVRDLKRASRSKWIVGVMYFLLFIGGEGFFAQALCTTGVLKLPPSFQWPAGYVRGVVTQEDGKQIVPLTPVARVQIYDSQWHFIRGWYVDTGGADFKVRSSPNGVVEIFTARGGVHYSFTQDGNLLSSGGSPEPFLSLPRGESVIVPTSPFLWVFSSPFLSWGVGVIGLVGLASLKKLGVIAAQ
jgi:hypothetical protein